MPAFSACATFCSWIALRIVTRPGIFSLISLIFVGDLAVIYANLEPRYRLADQVPDKQQAVAASGRLDAKLTGANPIDVLIEFPQRRETLSTRNARHNGRGARHAGETGWRWQCLVSGNAAPLASRKVGKSDVETLKEYVGYLPEHIVHRFLYANQDAAVVSGLIPDEDANRLLPLIDKLDQGSNTVRAASRLSNCGDRALGYCGQEQFRHD